MRIYRSNNSGISFVEFLRGFSGVKTDNGRERLYETTEVDFRGKIGKIFVLKTLKNL